MSLKPQPMALHLRQTHLTLALVLFSHAVLAADEYSGEDWPRFLGPQGNNTCAETGLLEKWPTNGLPLLWQREIGSGYSAPSVLGSSLVLHHRLRDEEVVECFDAATGKPNWR